MLTHLWKLSWVWPGGSGQKDEEDEPWENYALGPHISSSHSALGTILGAGVELLTRQNKA